MWSPLGPASDSDVPPAWSHCAISRFPCCRCFWFRSPCRSTSPLSSSCCGATNTKNLLVILSERRKKLLRFAKHVSGHDFSRAASSQKPQARDRAVRRSELAMPSPIAIGYRAVILSEGGLPPVFTRGETRVEGSGFAFSDLLLQLAA